MSVSHSLILVAACALIDTQKRVLIARRPAGKSLAGLWEFPGGKIESGECPEAAIVRELHEELGVTIKATCLKPLTFASHTYPDFHLLMPLFVCHEWNGQPYPAENQEIAWVDVADLIRPDSQFPMPPADAPLLPTLRIHLENRDTRAKLSAPACGGSGS